MFYFRCINEAMASTLRTGWRNPQSDASSLLIVLQLPYGVILLHSSPVFIVWVAHGSHVLRIFHDTESTSFTPLADPA